jgi:hypothetical protein
MPHEYQVNHVKVFSRVIAKQQVAEAKTRVRVGSGEAIGRT